MPSPPRRLGALGFQPTPVVQDCRLGHHPTGKPDRRQRAALPAFPVSCLLLCSLVPSPTLPFLLPERSLCARLPWLEGSKACLHRSVLECAPHASPKLFHVSELSWDACFCWGQPGCRQGVVVVVCPGSKVVVALHVVRTSVELSTPFVITRWALLLLKLQNLHYHLALKWKVIVLVEGVEIVGHASDIREANTYFGEIITVPYILVNNNNKNTTAKCFRGPTDK